MFLPLLRKHLCILFSLSFCEQDFISRTKTDTRGDEQNKQDKEKPKCHTQLSHRLTTNITVGQWEQTKMTSNS